MKSGLHQCSPWTTPGPLTHVFRDALLQWQRARKEKSCLDQETDLGSATYWLWELDQDVHLLQIVPHLSKWESHQLSERAVCRNKGDSVWRNMAMAPLPPSGESQWDLKSLVHNPKHPPNGLTVGSDGDTLPQSPRSGPRGGQNNGCPHVAEWWFHHAWTQGRCGQRAPRGGLFRVAEPFLSCLSQMTGHFLSCIFLKINGTAFYLCWKASWVLPPASVQVESPAQSCSPFPREPLRAAWTPSWGPVNWQALCIFSPGSLR